MDFLTSDAIAVPHHMEVPLDGQELTRILIHLKPGMKLTVPDEWLYTNIDGSPAQQANRISALACEFSCAHRHGIGFQTFERIDYPRLG